MVKRPTEYHPDLAQPQKFSDLDQQYFGDQDSARHQARILNETSKPSNDQEIEGFSGLNEEETEAAKVNPADEAGLYP